MGEREPIFEYRFGPFRLEGATGRLYRGAEEVPLPPRGSVLLEHLLERAGSVCGRDELVDAGWPDVDVGEKPLRTAMSRIRQALGDDPDEPDYVETFTGGRYGFIADVEVVGEEDQTVESSRKLGQYRILGRIGVGGMGRVYRARDTRLGREVAIKTLPPELAADPARVERFDREARLLAALNHPNVATLFGLEEWDGQRLLVMELVEGETLTARIERGPPALLDTLRIGVGVARAMEAAHRQGIVHRDLKPSNVMVTSDSGVKVLDFGIAKALRAAGIEETSAGQSETVASTDLTGGVALLGTPPYMSPEQVRGQEVDGRADIWAFGCVLYESLTGRRAFDRETVADTLAAILDDEPDWEALPRDLPGPIGSLLLRCLRKDPDRRLHHAADARIELEETAAALESGTASSSSFPGVAAPGGAPSRRAAGPWPWVAAAAILVAVAAILVPGLTGPGEQPNLAVDRRELRFTVELPAGVSIEPGEVQTYLAMSPAGDRLAFTANGGHLFVHDLASARTRRIEGVEGAASPVWSPDGRNLAYLAEGSLQRIAASGGSAQVLCEADWEAGTAWGAGDVILFAQPGPSGIAIHSVSAAGGTPQPVTNVDTDSEIAHFWPAFLPDGHRFLYLAVEQDHSQKLYVGSLDGDAPVVVAEVDSRAVYVPGDHGGHLLYASDGALVAQAFDLDSLQPQGAPVELTDELRHFAHTGQAEFSAALDPGRPAVAVHGGPWTTRLVWYAADGGPPEVLGEPAAHDQVEISPDGTQVLATVLDPRNGSRDLWIHDAAGQAAPRRLTAGVIDERYGVWSPDGERIAYRADSRGPPDIYVRPADGSGEEVALFRTPEVVSPEDWSDAAGGIVYRVSSRQTGRDQMLYELDAEQARPLLATPFSEWGGRISPDGELLAFVSDETGRSEIYVAPVGDPGARVPISRQGGASPRWGADGDTIHFLGAGAILRAELRRSPRLAAVEVEEVVTLPNPVFRGAWDMVPDGTRFLVNEAVEDTRSGPIRVIVGWTAALER